MQVFNGINGHKNMKKKLKICKTVLLDAIKLAKSTEPHGNRKPVQIINLEIDFNPA